MRGEDLGEGEKIYQNGCLVACGEPVESIPACERAVSKLMKQFGKLISIADSYDPLPHKDDVIEYRYDIYKNVSREAGKLRKSGKLLETAVKISCPVIAIHGDYDPHPAEGVRDPLTRILNDFRFVLLEKCGHKPWIERQAKDSFYEILKREILEN